MSVFFTRRGEAPPGGTFTINYYDAITQYKFKSGMTWEEWINSEYNTTGYYIADSYIRYPYGSSAVVWVPVGSDYAKVIPSDIIVKGETYHCRAMSPVAP